MKKKANTGRMDEWKRRLAESEQEYQSQLNKMDHREELYRGKRDITPLTEKDKKADGGNNKTPHIRNVIAENIESQVNSSIPQPKVTARRKEDESKAKLIEDMIRNELDRMPFEYINDQQERTVPIQGGSFYHLEWDNTKRTHTTVGELVISVRHPKQVIPQAGVFTSMEDMDWFFLKLPTTREAIKNRYNVDINEGEEEPEVRGLSTESPAADLVTQYMAIYRNSKGGIGIYSWANETELIDIEDYQARRLPHCKGCGELKPMPGDKIVQEQQTVTPDPLSAALGARPETVERVTEWREGDPCPWCGSTEWESREEEFQEIWDSIKLSDGRVIPGAKWVEDTKTGMMTQEPTKVPYYKPDVYPVVLQRNVSLFGQLLGDSDVDKIEDQQNTINRLEKKIIDRIITAGSRIIMPGQARHKVDTRDSEVWYVEGLQDASMIQVKDFTGNLQYEMAYLAQAYEESRQAIGITDSLQGRTDPTAKSGVAKQFAAAQSAGRMESKRVMKDAAYADLFRIMFQFRLAYADEPRPVVSQNSKGETVYSEFNRWDFLEQDKDGQWYWNDQFLFSTDTTAPLAQNRERMWEETVSLFGAGCFGNPQDPETLIAVWTKLELLHYPGAADTRKWLEERLKQQQAAMAQQQAAMAGMTPVMAGQQPPADIMQQLDQQAAQAAQADVMRQVEAKAEADARRAVFGGK